MRPKSYAAMSEKAEPSAQATRGSHGTLASVKLKIVAKSAPKRVNPSNERVRNFGATSAAFPSLRRRS
jgi:hypothetical protein